MHVRTNTDLDRIQFGVMHSALLSDASLFYISIVCNVCNVSTEFVQFLIQVYSVLKQSQIISNADAFVHDRELMRRL